jgi:hypothetical protein
MLTPRVDEIVQVLVQRLEKRANETPVQLLAEQREVDEFDKRRLQLAANLLTAISLQSRQAGGPHVRSMPSSPPLLGTVLRRRRLKSRCSAARIYSARGDGRSGGTPRR